VQPCLVQNALIAKRTISAMATVPGTSQSAKSISITVPPRQDPVPVSGVLGLSEDDLE
jgi:hypothetical protein